MTKCDLNQIVHTEGYVKKNGNGLKYGDIIIKINDFHFDEYNFKENSIAKLEVKRPVSLHYIFFYDKIPIPAKYMFNFLLKVSFEFLNYISITRFYN